jgi:hypothetical protein
MQRAIQVLAICVLTILGALLISAYARFNYYNPSAPEQSAALPAPAVRSLPQLIEAIDLDRPFTFAGEPVPTQNVDVRERLDRELIVNSYRHSVTILNIKNAHKYFPLMEPILERNGIPVDLKYIAVAESDLQNAVSPSGARGIWQFMGAMAGHYGLEISSEVDERYHVEKATQAACEYLLDVHRRFDNWTLAAAAYNLGETRLADELENQRVDSYYDLNLNEETSRYVFRLIALKEIINNPGQFGFHLTDQDKYPPLGDYRIVRVDGPVPNLADFAREHGTTYRLLKVYNPWLRTSRLSNPRRKVYEIKIPDSSL